MNITQPKLNELVRHSSFWLLAIASGLMAIHITLTFKVAIEGSSFVNTSLLCWAAASYLVWERREKLNLDSSLFASCLGVLLIAFVLLKNTHLYTITGIFRISPLISGLGLALLASGFKGVKQYWKELLILFLISGPDHAIGDLVNLSENLSLITAKFTHAALYYAGLESTRQGVNVILPTGAVEVNPGCSGLGIILQLFKLSLLFLLLFPTHLTKKLVLPIAAISIAFIVNGCRIVLLALLVAYSNKESFDYWHQGTGSLIFSMIAVTIFGALCFFWAQENEPEDYSPDES